MWDRQTRRSMRGYVPIATWVSKYAANPPYRSILNCRVRHIRGVVMVEACSRTDYQLQLSQTPVKDMAWWQLGQTSPILPSFMFERASFGDSARAAIQVLHARRECICSSVASSGVPRMVPFRHSKWLQSGSCRSLGSAPVRLPSRCTGYTTYLISGSSTVAATVDTLRSESRRYVTL